MRTRPGRWMRGLDGELMLIADLPILLVLPVLIVLAGVFSGSETALFGLTYHDRLRLRRASPRAEGIAAQLLRSPRGLLVSLLLLNTCVTVLYFVLTSALLIRHKDRPALALAINIVCVLALIVLGELLPKVLAGANRVTACRLVAGPIRTLHRLIAPVRTLVVELVVGPMTRLIRPPHAGGAGAVEHRSPGGPDFDGTVALTVEELSALVELGGREGAIDPGEQEVLAQVLQLGTLKVRDVMMPRVRMTWLDSAASPQRIAQVVASTRLTKIPVRRRSAVGSPPTILGLLNTKRYLAAASGGGAGGVEGSGTRATDFIEAVRYVPDSARLDKLLEYFRTARVQLALCVNEHGAVVGSVKIEDIAERLVAELAAGEPGGAGEQEVRSIGPGRWLVPGRLNVRDWADMFGQAADPRVSTVAGLVQARLGRIPAAGDSVTLGNVRIEVESVIGKVVDRLIVSLAEQSGPAREGAPAATETSP